MPQAANVLSLLVANALIDNRQKVAESVLSGIANIMTLYPPYVLQYLANAGVRVVPLKRGDRYDEASRALKRLGVDVDMWPAPPAGLFVVEERTVYVRSYSTMTICHELGHACDLALGGGIYRSTTDARVRNLFADAKAYITPYAATGVDEYVAESIRAVLEANDPQSFWPRATRARLKRIDSEMYAYVNEVFEEMRAAIEGAAA